MKEKCPRCDGEKITLVEQEVGAPTLYYCDGCTLIFENDDVWLKERLGVGAS